MRPVVCSSPLSCCNSLRLRDCSIAVKRIIRKREYDLWAEAAAKDPTCARAFFEMGTLRSGVVFSVVVRICDSFFTHNPVVHAGMKADIKANLSGAFFGKIAQYSSNVVFSLQHLDRTVCGGVRIFSERCVSCFSGYFRITDRRRFLLRITFRRLPVTAEIRLLLTCLSPE